MYMPRFNADVRKQKPTRRNHHEQQRYHHQRHRHRHPDFLVSRQGRTEFYLEAVAVSNSRTEEAEANRMNQVYEALNSLHRRTSISDCGWKVPPRHLQLGQSSAGSAPDGWRLSTAKQSDNATSINGMETYLHMNGATMAGTPSSIPCLRAKKRV
jgi:hypothetical protein